MTRLLRYSIFLALLLVFSKIGVGNVSAVIVPTAFNVDLSTTTQRTRNDLDDGSYKQSFTATESGRLYSMEIFIGKNASSPNNVQVDSISMYTGATSTSGGVQSVSNAQMLSTTPSTLVYTWTTSSAPNIVAGQSYNYLINVNPALPSNGIFDLYGGNSYAGGAFYNCLGAGCSSSYTVVDPPGDLTFAVYVERDDIDDIQFINTTTAVCDFSFFTEKVSLSPGTRATFGNDYGVSVMYGLSPSLQIIQGFNWVSLSEGQTGYLSTITPKEAELTDGYTIYATPYICSSIDKTECDFAFGANSGNILAVGDTWEFIKDPMCGEQKTATPQSPITVTSTNAGDNLTCDEADSFFASSMCHLFQYLFLPSSQSMNNFTGLKDQLAVKPPFGYISVYSSAIGSVETASTTTSTLSTIDTQLPLDVLEGFDILQTLKTVLTTLLWLVFAWYVYKRFRDFSLQG